jgi:hypothetical protein
MALRKYRKAMHYLDNCWDNEEIDEEKSCRLRKIKSQILTNSSIVLMCIFVSWENVAELLP